MKISEILNGCLTYLICELGEFFYKEFLSSACGLMKSRHGRAKAWGCREDPRRGRGGLLPPMDVPSMPRKFTVRPDLCRGGL
jgi:hypothetical protein